MLLVHPGGPFWAKRDAGDWSIPKGEYDDGEDALAAALREFEEEVGSALDPAGELVALGDVRQKNRKLVTAWAAEGEVDAGAWSIPKGEYDDGEDPLAAALREFEEEVGSALDAAGELVALGDVRQKNRKLVTVWAAEGDVDASAVRSNTFAMEWPPRSGRTQEFPEIDRAEWFSLARAREKLIEAQVAFLDRLEEAGQAALARRER